MRTHAKLFVALLAVAAVALPIGTVSAATNPSFTQVINAGTQSVDIVDGTGASVSSPTVAFGAVNFSFDCQDATATLAPSTGTVRKIAVKNPTQAGIKVDINAVTPTTDKWTDGTKTYKYNDSTSDGTTAGCANGQLSVGTGTFTKTKGAASVTQTAPGGTFSGTSAVTLLNATSATAFEGTLTNYSLTQKIPAEQLDGSYSLPMNITFTQQ